MVRRNRDALEAGEFDDIVVTVMVLSAELIARDKFRSIDTYCEVGVGDTREKTRVVKKTWTPEWRQEVTLKSLKSTGATTEDGLSHELRIAVYHRSALQNNPCLGSTVLPLHEFVFGVRYERTYALLDDEHSAGSIHIQLERRSSTVEELRSVVGSAEKWAALVRMHKQWLMSKRALLRRKMKESRDIAEDLDGDVNGDGDEEMVENDQPFAVQWKSLSEKLKDIVRAMRRRVTELDEEVKALTSKLMKDGGTLVVDVENLSEIPNLKDGAIGAKIDSQKQKVRLAVLLNPTEEYLGHTHEKSQCISNRDCTRLYFEEVL